MNNKYIFTIIAAALLVIGGYVIASSNQRTEQANEAEQAHPVAAETDVIDNNSTNNDQLLRGDAMLEPMNNTSTAPDNAAVYTDYSPSAVEEAQAKGDKVVLFFHASWCPDCRAADAAFKANTSGIPAEVTLLKTDYDSNPALKQKYGVTYQHTFVQIDNVENKITSWVSGDIAKLQANVR